MTTRIESTQHSVLAWCTDCATWTYLAGSRGEARRAAREHEHLVHPGSKRASSRNARAKIRDTHEKLHTQ